MKTLNQINASVNKRLAIVAAPTNSLSKQDAQLKLTALATVLKSKKIPVREFKSGSVRHDRDSNLFYLAVPVLPGVDIKLVASIIAKSFGGKAVKSNIEGSGDYLWDLGIFRGAAVEMFDRPDMNDDDYVSVCITYEA